MEPFIFAITTPLPIKPTNGGASKFLRPSFQDIIAEKRGTITVNESEFD